MGQLNHIFFDGYQIQTSFIQIIYENVSKLTLTVVAILTFHCSTLFPFLEPVVSKYTRFMFVCKQTYSARHIRP